MISKVLLETLVKRQQPSSRLYVLGYSGGCKYHNFLALRVNPTKDYIFGFPVEILTSRAIDWYINDVTTNHGTSLSCQIKLRSLQSTRFSTSTDYKSRGNHTIRPCH